MRVSTIVIMALSGSLTLALASEGVKGGGCPEGYYYSQKVHECIKYERDAAGHIIRPALEKEKAAPKGKDVPAPDKPGK